MVFHPFPYPSLPEVRQSWPLQIMISVSLSLPAKGPEQHQNQSFEVDYILWQHFERRKKRDLKLLFTFQTQPPPGLRTCFMRKKGAEPIGSDTVPSPAELKTTWHYSKWNWCTDRLPTPEGEGPHNTPLFPLRDQTILLLLLLGMGTIQKHCHGHQDQGHTKFRWSCNLLYQRKEREGKELKLNTDDYHWSEQHWQLTIVIFPSFKKYTHFQFCQARRSPRTQQCLYPSTSAALDSPWRLSSL